MGVTRLLGLVGGCLGPCTVFAAAVWGLSPVAAPGEAALALDRLVRAQDAEVVVIGASFASADIEPTLLGERLSPGSGKALVLQVAASAAPVWYAILKERVYGGGLEPKLILLPVSLGSALETRLSSSEMEKLVYQMPVPDDVVARRSLGYGPLPAFERLAQAGGRARDGVIRAFRDAPPRWLHGVDGEGVDAAGAQVFGECHNVAEAGMFPGWGRQTTNGEPTDAETPVDDPAESYLSDIVDLADQHEGRVVIAIPPTRDPEAGGPAPATLTRLAAWAERRGVAFLDYRDLGWTADQFRDDRHMTKAAARVFTAMIAEDVGRLQAAGKLPLAWGDGLVPSRVSRAGTPPVLPEARWTPGATPCEGSVSVPGFGFLGRNALAQKFPWFDSPIELWEGDRVLAPPFRRGECTGSAVHRGVFLVSRRSPTGAPLSLRWSAGLPTGTPMESVFWAYPGTTLAWTFTRPWGAEVSEVALVAGFVGPGKGVAEMRLGDDVRVPLTGAEGIGGATGTPPPGDGWVLTVSSPPDGPYVAVRALSARVGGVSVDIMPTARPRHIEVFLTDTWTVPPTPPPAPAYPVHAGAAGAWFELGWTPVSECSPLRVEYGGELLPKAPAGKLVDNRTRHTQTRLTFTPVRGSDPLVGYRVAYDPHRLCTKACPECPERVWLYPSEVIRSEVGIKNRGRLGAPTQLLLVDATIDQTPPERGALLRVTVTLGDEVVADRSLAPAELAQPVGIPLTRPIAAADPGALRVSFTSDPRLPPVMLSASFEDQ